MNRLYALHIHFNPNRNIGNKNCQGKNGQLYNVNVNQYNVDTLPAIKYV